MVQDRTIRTYNGRSILNGIRSIKRRHIQRPWTTLTPDSRSHHYLMINISETVRHTDSFNGLLIGTYTRPTQHCHFEWPWVTAKYSMTRSVAQSLCDS